MPAIPKVYFSYAWGDDETPEGQLRAEAANALYQRLKERESRNELQVIIDHEQMGYKSRIRDFTKQFGDSSILIVMIISEKYLKSDFCMGEVVEILSNKDYQERIFPVVLPDAKLEDAKARMKYRKEWDKRKEELEEEYEGIKDKTYTTAFREQIDDIAEIIRIIANFTTEMGYTLTARPPDYSPLLQALDERIAEMNASAKGGGGGTFWTPIFVQYPLRDDLRPSITVNCDREEHYRNGLRAHFKKEMSGKNNLFYCIVACPFQRPASIAKRLVYEIEETKLPIMRMADAARPDEVIVSRLEPGFAPEHTWELIWGELQQRLGASGQPIESLQSLGEQSGNNRRIALVYRLHAQNWEADSIEHLRHIALQFQGMPEASRKYLFLLAIEFPHIHDLNREKYRQKLEQLKDLCRDLSDAVGLRAACFDLLPPVEEKSIESWSSDVFVGEKKRAWGEVLARLRLATSPTTVFFDMEQVETMQEAAWAYRNRPRPNLPF